MDAVFYHIVVVDGCPGVNNGKAAYPGSGIDNSAGHNHRALSDRNIRGDDCARMDRSGEAPALRENKQSELAAEARLADRDQHRVLGKKFLFFQAPTVT